MNALPAIEVHGVSHRYGARLALDQLDLSIASGELFAVLGPNGGGKTTLFRLASTLTAVQSGRITIAGFDIQREAHSVRQCLGVVFQSPSLDAQLTVRENLWHQGHLYGLSGHWLEERIDAQLARFQLADRAGERCRQLSGGLRRRVELAKALLHEPKVLLLDEPSTGLDPAARRQLGEYLRELCAAGVTVALTTHLLEEAESADRIAILSRGRLVACDTPARLRSEVGGDSITLTTADAPRLVSAIEERFGLAAQVVDGAVRLELADGHQWIARLVEAFPGQFRSVTLAKPSLEDVFLQRTGQRFAAEPEAEAAHG